MSDIQARMRSLARELLEKGEVQYVIGWEKGIFPYQSTPVFITRPEDAEKLVWDEYCLANLAIYLLDDRQGEGKVALFIKGCDSRGVLQIVKDRQAKRERLYLIGIPCPGLKDPEQAAQSGDGKEVPLEPKCRNCTHHNPPAYDVLLGEPVPEDAAALDGRFEALKEMEALTPDERYDQWAAKYDLCLRCFACRNVCPACNCTVCCFDLPREGWLSKEVNRSGNQFYGLTRALHVAGRCIECGECERVCPVGIPIMAINRKIAKDINELFGPYEAGMDLEALPPLGFYNAGDPEFEQGRGGGKANAEHS